MIHPLGALLHEVLRKSWVRPKVAHTGVGDRDGRSAEIGRTRLRAARRGERRIEVDDVEGVAEAGLVDFARAEVSDERRVEGVRAPFGVGAAVVGVQRADALPFL